MIDNFIIAFSNYVNNRNICISNTKFINEIVKLPFERYYRKINKFDGFSKIFKTELHYKIYLYKYKKYIYLPIDDLILNQFYYTYLELTNPFCGHYYESLGTTVAHGDVVIDCGAAEGLFSLINENKAKRIYLIEPLKKFSEALSKTFLKSTNIEILNYALAESNMELKMTDEGVTSKISNIGSQAVKAKSMDSIFFDNGIDVDFIKADLEGYELDMIRGAANLISKCKPKIAITTYDYPNHVMMIKNELIKYNPNYKIKTKGITCNFHDYSKTNCNWPMMLHAW